MYIHRIRYKARVRGFKNHGLGIERVTKVVARGNSEMGMIANGYQGITDKVTETPSR